VSDPISVALRGAGNSVDWLNDAVDVAAVVGLASTVLVTFYGQTRILMRMSSDGMLPAALGRVSARFKTPVTTTLLCGAIGAIVAGLVPISVLGDLVSIGTLLAFLIVCSGVLVLRHTHPDIPRPFRVPHVRIIAPLGIASALALMAMLPVETWLRLVVWLLIGLCIYFGYSRRRTRAQMAALVDAEPGGAASPTAG